MKIIFKKIIVYILQIESRLILLRYKPKVVAITGSIGKTSTKDAVYAVLASITYVRKSDKSYNSEIGLPLTILGCANAWNDPRGWFANIFKGLWLLIWPQKYPKWLVLEVGVGKPGDIKRTASWLKSDVVIITMIGETPAHIEFFDSRKHLVEEKSGLIKTLKKDGFLILNADDEATPDLRSKTKNLVLTYGFAPKADIVGSGDSIFYADSGEPSGIIFRIDEGGNSLPVVIEGVFGRNHVYATLAALAFSFSQKFNMLNAINSLKKYDISPGRMRLLPGINGSLIIDDTYNSSPLACESAIRTLFEIKCLGRKIAVLGDMLELGKHTIEAHKHIGQITKEKAEVLVVVGPRAKAIKEGAEEAGMNNKNIFEFLNSREAGEFLKTFIKKDDLVLVKGSQGVRMERAVEAILEDTKNLPAGRQDQNKLLVRQDKEWLKKE